MVYTLPTHSYQTWFMQNRQQTSDKLCALVEINTTSPNELDAYPFLESYLNELNIVPTRLKLHPELEKVWDRSRHPQASINKNFCNLRAEIFSSFLNSKTVVFSTHVDVVPPSPHMSQPFRALCEGNIIKGRGACDTKNNIVMLLEALRCIKNLSLPLRKNVILDFVIQEEIGGNGALSSVLYGIKADGAVCLEPTGLRLFRGHRGCATLDFTCRGKGAHMGSDQHPESAIDLCYLVNQSLKALEVKWTGECRVHPAFGCWVRPIQINIGMIRGGDWHGSVPTECVIGANVGFPPWIEMAKLPELIIEALNNVNADLPKKVSINFAGILNDAYLTDKNAWIVDTFAKFCKESGDIFAWNASCDARTYAKKAGIPTVIFGSGQIEHAHSADEQINLEELERGAEILVHFLTTE